ncbi:hypothetical protein DFH27DRAFT_650291 [Peziza echinospora]|nr:hypothetical protein DFH27DRAFT_650291 [Peziza echinospora]
MDGRVLAGEGDWASNFTSFFSSSFLSFFRCSLTHNPTSLMPRPLSTLADGEIRGQSAWKLLSKDAGSACGGYRGMWPGERADVSNGELHRVGRVERQRTAHDGDGPGEKPSRTGRGSSRSGDTRTGREWGSMGGWRAVDSKLRRTRGSAGTNSSLYPVPQYARAPGESSRTWGVHPHARDALGGACRQGGLAGVQRASPPLAVARSSGSCVGNQRLGISEQRDEQRANGELSSTHSFRVSLKNKWQQKKHPPPARQTSPQAAHDISRSFKVLPPYDRLDSYVVRCRRSHSHRNGLLRVSRVE